ncbi:hypothetical protein K505DRAFT_122973 [Melanomma pulvis-pyrius CBS 109.77]|uniref:Zn(2)-C6 fungal-type domain-containing protein n=1 Tax=Melanomma pulvis-pyrius CBS 109.77 TaxID=1314802 RepID=A0A6A6WUS4_9PLEO|nr:hypothetical protein K505DRAFT_122973 [Melanomma pulvis-pyrius CBS 109.77]
MMPSMVHAPIMNNVGYMLKEKSGDAVVSAFTAVNGRTSPPSPRRLTDTNVNTNANTTANPITVETNHVRSLSRPTPIQTQAQNAPLPGRDEWASGPRVSENGHRNGHQNGHHSVSSSLSDQDTAQHSPGKRKRSISTDDVHSYHSPDGTVRRRLDSYAPRDDSPPNSAMERSQQRPLPPMDRVDRVDRADHDRNWQRRESQDMPHANYSNSHRRDSQDMETSPDSVNPRPSSQMGNLDGVETTRAGVQVDPKKRKRQFANRTKTGCGTCRRRKKKCDEGKPECINCTRGGFICEGYANKVPWPKNGTTKSHPPLQAKDRFPAESQGQLYHKYDRPTDTLLNHS